MWRTHSIRVVVFIAFWGGLLFAGAGRLDWVRGWMYLALYLISMLTILGIVIPRNPELIRERWKKRKDTLPFDKLFGALSTPLVLSLPIVAGLDAVRFRWSALSPALAFVGLLLHLAGCVPLVLSMIENPHLETTVRIQRERHHQVITTGPYRFVRHPMYVGIILFFAGMPLMLGSVWTYLPLGIWVALLVWRTSREDQALRRELPGYEDYTKKTRYRLLPGLW